MARQYNVEGTNDYLIFGIALLAFAAWCVMDGWFPPPRVLERRPRENIIHAETEGVIAQVRTSLRQDVPGGTVVATLRREEWEARQAAQQVQHEEARAQVARLRAAGAAETDVAEAEAGLAAAAERLAEAELALTKLELRATDSGQVIRHYVVPGDRVAEGDPVVGLFLSEHQNFYTFNRVSAVVCVLGALFCFGLHFKSR
jgi:multidrug resistance efflux pump